MELDQKTTVHCRRTESLCNMLCRVLNLNNDIASMICLAAEYHDIGKSKIPASILFKPGKLTDDEWKIMKTHAKIGYDLMSDFPENVRLMISYLNEQSGILFPYHIVQAFINGLRDTSNGQKYAL